MRLSKLYWPFEFFFTIYLPKLFDYAKVLWFDYDFEYEYLLPLIETKTRRTREYLLSEGAVEVDERRMKEVECLCRRLKADDYCAFEYAEIDSRYPVDEIMDRALDFNSRLALDEQYWKERRALFAKTERIKAADKDRLFYLLHKNLNRWWS